MNRRRLSGLVAALAVVLLGVVGTGAGPSSAVQNRVSDDAGSTGTESSAVTASGSGRFSDVKVTVSQTQHLVNQVVHVTWTGAKPTSPKVGSFDKNYMQIMECWGDNPDIAPKREDCQYGSFDGDSRGGQWVASRQVTYGSSLTDPEETIVKPEGTFKNLSVPFTSVKGDTTTNFPNPYFDSYSTNEEPFGRTGADGNGQDFFEVQTAQQAPGLGCGQRLSNGAARNCWLVVVPRDNTEVDGSRPADRLLSSPLSQSNWDNAISIRMNFDPLGVNCPIGASERRLLGQEEVSEAIVRWQPVLCQQTKAIFGFSQISDDLSRAQVLQPDPWMSFVSKPVGASAAAGKTMAYAPITLGGIGIGFNLDKQPAYGASDAINAQAGQRVTSLNLNARLVAKLLTQSYKIASYLPTFPNANPGDLGSDPEFQKLNPDLAGFDLSGIYQISVPEGLSDAYEELWNWVNSDPDAKAFIDGKTDPWGAKVNPLYKGLSLLGLNSFPRADLNCKPIGGQLPLCPLDKLAYAQDLHEGTRGAARGDTLARNLWDPAASPAAYKKQPPQLSGSRRVLTLTDTATAARYSLPLASLENASGKFVAPSESSILRGLDAMTPTETPGVSIPDPAAKGAGVYPLPHLTYAVTDPSSLDKAEAKDYSAFLKYVVGDGQIQGIAPGQLPAGYVPLTPGLLAQTKAAADLVAKQGGPKSTATADPTATPTTSDTTGPTDTASLPSNPSSAPAPATGQSPGPVALTPAQMVAFTTPKGSPGFPRYVLLGSLLLGILAALGRPALVLLHRRRFNSTP